jgi:hypothetical protein
LDIISVEQDDIRTYGDGVMKKADKDMLEAKERDALIQDTWECFEPKNRKAY